MIAQKNLTREARKGVLMATVEDVLTFIKTQTGATEVVTFSDPTRPGSKLIQVEAYISSGNQVRVEYFQVYKDPVNQGFLVTPCPLCGQTSTLETEVKAAIVASGVVAEAIQIGVIDRAARTAYARALIKGVDGIIRPQAYQVFEKGGTLVVAKETVAGLEVIAPKQ